MARNDAAEETIVGAGRLVALGSCGAIASGACVYIVSRVHDPLLRVLLSSLALVSLAGVVFVFLGLATRLLVAGKGMNDLVGTITYLRGVNASRIVFECVVALIVVAAVLGMVAIAWRK